MPANCPSLSHRSRIAWRALQVVVWLLGLTIFVLLIVAPRLGIAAFWNILIPVAPALLVFAPGVWRNICPLGVTALLARHLGWSARRELSTRARAWLNLAVRRPFRDGGQPQRQRRDRIAGTALQ